MGHDITFGSDTGGSGTGGAGTGYRADPAGSPRGGMILIHEMWGLNAHTRDVADRWAAEGWAVIAPDLLTGVGIPESVGEELAAIMHSSDPEVRQAGQPRLREAFAAANAPGFAEGAVATLRAAVDALTATPGIDGIVVVGYCFGGTYAFELAAADQRVLAAVPYYGAPPADERLAAIRCPVLGIYGGLDERLMTPLPELRTAMEAAGVDFETIVYPDAQHAFFNDAGPRYDAAAAEDAWAVTNSFLDRVAAPR